MSEVLYVYVGRKNPLGFEQVIYTLQSVDDYLEQLDLIRDSKFRTWYNNLVLLAWSED